jgi:hypothetical protein
MENKDGGKTYFGKVHWLIWFIFIFKIGNAALALAASTSGGVSSWKGQILVQRLQLVKKTSMTAQYARRIPSQDVSSSISVPKAIASFGKILSDEHRSIWSCAPISYSADSVKFAPEDKDSLLRILMRDIAKNGMRLYTLLGLNLRVKLDDDRKQLTGIYADLKS